MATLLSARLVAAAVVWAALVTVGRGIELASAADLVGAFLGSLLLMALLKLVYVKTKSAVSGRGASDA